MRRSCPGGVVCRPAGDGATDEEGDVAKKAKSTTAGKRARRAEEPAPTTEPAPESQPVPAVSEATATAEPAEQTEPIEQAEPDPFATAWTELDMRCPTCSIIHYVPVCIFLNARESPHLVQRVIKGHFNLKRCPLCRKIEPVDYPWTFYDPDRKLAVQVRSEWEYHAGGGEEWYAARLEDFFDKWADYDVRIDVVFSQKDLIERFLQDAPAPPARR
jgi:hypothetical protein